MVACFNSRGRVLVEASVSSNPYSPSFVQTCRSMLAIIRHLVTLLVLAILPVSGEQTNVLYTDDDTNISILNSLLDYDTIVRPSPSVWMLQFYHPSSGLCQTFAKEYKLLGKLVDGFLRLATVDISTEGGLAIFKSLKIDEGRDFVENPALFTVSPHPFDNMNSLPKKYKGEALPKTPELGQVLFNHVSVLMNDRHTALKLDDTADYKKKQNTSHKSKANVSAVVEVNEANFDALVLQNPNLVVVAFTAPWCGYCKQLKPEWEEAAEKLSEESITMAWVDATANQQLAALFQVQGYPTIKLFEAGTPKNPTMATTYEGPRQAPGIVESLLQELEKAGVLKEIPELTDTETLEKNCSGTNHICVLAALPHILESGADGRNKYRNTLSEVSKSFRGTAFSFLWFEAGQQPDLETKLEMTFGAPALVAYSMGKQAYAVLRGSFTEKSLTSFLHGITSGRQHTLPLSEAPVVVATEPWDGLDAQPLEDEIPLSEILGDDEF